MNLKGKIIAIEGTDGSGKQTQTQKLIEKLKNEGYSVYSISFPNYSSDSSAPVRMYLNGEMGASPSAVSAKAASILFAVDRYVTYKKEIEELYNKQDTVFVFDRYTASNIIHQGSKLMTESEVDLKKLEQFILWVSSLEHEEFKIPKADVTIYLNVPIDYTKNLRKGRVNKIDNSTKQDIHEADDSYLNNCAVTGMCAAKLLNWKVVECVNDGAMRSVEDISEEIWNILK